jgi:hypothetical protein
MKATKGIRFALWVVTLLMLVWITVYLYLIQSDAVDTARRWVASSGAVEQVTGKVAESSLAVGRYKFYVSNGLNHIYFPLLVRGAKVEAHIFIEVRRSDFAWTVSRAWFNSNDRQIIYEL